MSSIVTGLFDNINFAKKAAEELKSRGFSSDDISIIAKDRESSKKNTPSMSMGRNDDISDGVVTGGIMGGLAGLLIGAGSLMIPGFGLIAAAGPITGLISGALTGGIMGGLIDLGIPESKSRQYEEDIKGGKIFLSMKTDSNNLNTASDILKTNGALSVDTFNG